MKLSRRGIFGMFGGAAAAASQPSAIVGDLIRPGSVTGGGLWAGALPPTQENTADGLKEALRELLKKKTKTEESYAQNTAEREAKICDIDVLRSVSAGHKRRMVARMHGRVDAVNRSKWIDEQIAEAKEKLGLLGQLL